VYARNCQATTSSLSLFDEVGRPPEENSQRRVDDRERKRLRESEREREREREREITSFSFLSANHSTSASIVFHKSRHE